MKFVDDDDDDDCVTELYVLVSVKGRHTLRLGS